MPVRNYATLLRTSLACATLLSVVAPDSASAAEKTPWIERYVPRRNTAELGVYGGVAFPSRDHELFSEDTSRTANGFQRFRSTVPEIGARAAYLPIRFFALELEGGVAPTKTAADNRALLWTVRGHAVAQLGLWSVTPFVLAGAGGLGVASATSAVGNDVDLAFHFGGGVKAYVTRRLLARIDVRDVVAARQGVSDGVSHTPEILLGFSVVLGRAPAAAKAKPSDRDRDGFVDPEDHCPDVPGVAPHGCPIGDRDKDSFLDPDDACPDVPGVAPDGCPIGDRDRDSFLDPVDRCIDEPGVAPDGCPLRDRDGDGILDPDDQCVDQPETRNGFEDADGCPDELPEAVRNFTGVIEGIHFDLDRDTIRKASTPVLDRAVAALVDYPSVRLEISGHTDSTGKHDHNLDLSRRRALSVRRYLVDHGVAADRITTRGVGPDEPLADNTTDSGRQKNRRIEFRVIESTGAAQ